MPNRILKESVCTSPNVDALSLEAEVFFYRLMVQCDDYGRMDARPAILRARCFPLRLDSVTDAVIGRQLQELINAGLIVYYQVDGMPYLQFATWEKHQQVRAKHSKFPPMQSSDINCDQVISNVPVIQSNPIRIQSESESNLDHDVIADDDELPTPAETKKVQTAQQEFFGAICEAIGWDYRTITKTQSGQVAQAIKALQKGGYSAADVRQFRDWWMTFDWRGLKGQAPTINQLRSDIGKIRQPVPAHQPSSNGRNGRNGTGYQTGIDWDARIGAVIPRYGAESDHEIDM